MNGLFARVENRRLVLTVHAPFRIEACLVKFFWLPIYSVSGFLCGQLLMVPLVPTSKSPSLPRQREPLKPYRDQSQIALNVVRAAA